jgi:hypothetical protein
MANKYMKKCSTFSAIKELQIKMTLRFHFSPVGIAVIKKTNDCWQGSGGGKGTFIHCWWECKLVQSQWKSVWKLLKKTKVKLPCDSAIPLLGIYPKEYMST